MIDSSQALSATPPGLREPLLAEYKSIVENYSAHRWKPSELSGGFFCEIVYTILHGYSSGKYASKPSKPDDFVGSCRQLEKHKHVPRSFQVLIPRTLPALYEVRNNRGVGHTGGDVDPNHMDATFVLTTANWVLAELVRVFHALPISDAQQLVDSLADRRVPLVWEGANVKRVLDPTLNVGEQTLLLLASVSGQLPVAQLFEWLDYHNRAYFMKTLREYHKRRLVNLSNDEERVELLPPGDIIASEIISRSRS